MATATSERREQIAMDELAEQGYNLFWVAESPGAVIRCYGNGAGKLVLLATYAQRNGWEMFRPLTSSNKVSHTLAALGRYTRNEAEVIE